MTSRQVGDGEFPFCRCVFNLQTRATAAPKSHQWLRTWQVRALNQTLSSVIPPEQKDGLDMYGGPSQPKLFHDSVGFHSSPQHS